MTEKDKLNSEQQKRKPTPDTGNEGMSDFSKKQTQEIFQELSKKSTLPKTKKESQEKIIIPELEEHTFRIESTGWKEEEMVLYDGGTIRVSMNKKGDVIEYLDDPFKGEQLFVTYDAFVQYACVQKKCTRKILEKKYLPTEEKLTLLLGPQKTKSEKYLKVYNNLIKDTQHTGYFIPRGEKLGRVSERALVRIADGNDVEMGPEGWKLTNGGKNYGFSGHLFK